MSSNLLQPSVIDEFTQTCAYGKISPVRSRLKFEDVLRAHLERRTKDLGREKLAGMLKMTPTNLDYYRTGYRMRKDKKGRSITSKVGFPPSLLDRLAQAEGVSITDKIRQIAVEVATNEVIADADAVSEGDRVERTAPQK